MIARAVAFIIFMLFMLLGALIIVSTMKVAV